MVVVSDFIVCLGGVCGAVLGAWWVCYFLLVVLRCAWLIVGFCDCC